MKKGIYILLIACLGFSIFSCSDYLDSDYIFKNRKTIEKVFTNRDSTEAFLANAFSYLGDDCADVCNKRITPHCFADDMYYGDDDGDIQESKESQLSYNEFKEGRYDENTKQGVWQRCYQGIRQASLFLQYIDLNKELARQESFLIIRHRPDLYVLTITGYYYGDMDLFLCCLMKGWITMLLMMIWLLLVHHTKVLQNTSATKWH